ncbi:MAG: HEAT repeat domain-containing protein [Gemmatimonadetes bacterium]|nr:HEAT repeat domain-containing protein [Gemmatimonadota bacterium]
MTQTAPEPNALVDALATSDTRFPAYQDLVGLGEEALPAIRRGLVHDDWQVRKWSAMVLDQVADAESLAALVPLLRDPKADVRLWAVHSLACDHCKDEVACPVDVVPHLIERIEVDESIRVRRMATIMLGTEYADPRAVPVLRRLLNESDAKLRGHALRAVDRYAELGVT